MQMSARGGNLQALLNFNFAPLLPMHLTMHCCMPSLFPKTFKTLKIMVLARPTVCDSFCHQCVEVRGRFWDACWGMGRRTVNRESTHQKTLTWVKKKNIKWWQAHNQSQPERCASKTCKTCKTVQTDRLHRLHRAVETEDVKSMSWW